MLAARIRQARKALGLTQKELAIRLGVTLNAANAWEAGRSTPGGKPLMKLVELGINGQWLLSGEGEVMGSSAHPKEPQTLSPLTPDYQDVIEQLKEAGLLDVFLNKETDGVVEQKWRVMSVLQEAGRALTLKEIQGQIGSSSLDLEATHSILRDLEMRSVVKLDNGIWDLDGNPSLSFHLDRPFPVSAKLLLFGLGQRVIPGIQDRNKSGGIAIFEGCVNNRETVFLEIREHIKTMLQQLDTPEGDKFSLYLCFG